MTGRATYTAHVHVARMIKVHAKALQTWEGLERAGFDVRVTDGAYRTVRIRKLLCMTTSARQVIGSARTLGYWRFGIAPMT